MDIPEAEPVRRQVYIFKRANWDQLCGSLLAQDWRPVLSRSADEACAEMTRIILARVADHIPSATITDKVYVHPWLDDKCKLALRHRNAAEGTSWGADEDAAA